MKTNELNIEKGRRLKECILKKYDSQRAFADIVTKKGYYNLSPTNLNAMIQGNRTISRDFAYHVAPLLEVSDKYLMCETDIPFELPWDINPIGGNDSLIQAVVRLLECKNQSPIYFYTIDNYKSPKTMLMVDFLNKHKKGLNLQGDYTFILSRLLMFECSLFPMDRKELEKHRETFINSSELDKQAIILNDWGSVRRKCTIDELSGMSLSNPQCIYKDNNSQCETIIECVSVNDHIMSYGDFVSLANICSNMAVSLFNHSTDLNYINIADNYPLLG